jgi:hypothetical protein
MPFLSGKVRGSFEGNKNPAGSPEKITPEKNAPNYYESGRKWWERKIRSKAAAAAGRERAERLGINLGLNGGKRTRKNKSKKRSKSRKN